MMAKLEHICMVLILNLATTVILASNHRVRPQSCSATRFQSSSVTQSNERCVTMNVQTDVVGFETCCSTEATLQDDFRTTDSSDGQCRDVIFENAYCGSDPSIGCDLSHDDSLRISLNMFSTAEDSSCCETCTCYGDPDCVAFDGTRDEWVICDARNADDRCSQSKGKCLDQVDHQGNQCVWKKYWKGWRKSGGPCQPDYKADGFEWPRMLMHKRGEFELWLTLGERGIITKVDMHTTNGVHSLSSDACWDEDGASSAWEGDPVPGAWMSQYVTNNQEIQWSVGDDDKGIIVQLICARLGRRRNSPTRIDIKSVIETNVGGGEMSGFCSSGSISQKTGSTNETAWKHAYCTERSLPSLREACAAIMEKKSCGSSVQDEITYWCEHADLTDTPAVGDSVACKDQLLAPEVSEQEINIAWTRYICAINKVEHVECMSKIGQFGWDDFLGKYSNGILPNRPTESMTCAQTADMYVKVEEECGPGIRVEIQRDGEWEQYFHIPEAYPPCNNELLVYGDEHPDLFKYPIRFRQCTCNTLASVSCQPTQGYEVSLNFQTNNCNYPTRSPIAPPPTLDFQRPPTFICTEEAQQEYPAQTICDASDMETPRPIGTCSSLCPSIDMLSGNGESVCRTVSLDAAFCDATIDNDFHQHQCQSLPEYNATLTLDITYDQNMEDMQCCNKCTCFGDPLCVDFSGKADNWILCDSRQADCWVNQDICSSQVDHGGNACVWNERKYKQLTKRGRAAIGALGSPCTADFSKSGPAKMTMYEIEDGPKFEISMGERGVIETVEITTNAGSFHLIADRCFQRNIFGAWSTSPSNLNAQDHLELTFSNGNSKDERFWRILEPESGIYLTVMCIRKKAGGKKGYRINVESLIELDSQRMSSNAASGFCVDGTINKGQSVNTVTENVYAKCNQGLGDSLQVCKALWTGSCTNTDIERGARIWCEAATYPGGADACKEAVGDGENANAWITAYCVALFQGQTGVQSQNTFVDQCVSRIHTDGIDGYVDEHGRATFSANSVASGACVSNPDEYRPRTREERCVPGITLEFWRDGTWHEELFIPYNRPPCPGALHFAASHYFNLFVHPIRLRQCEIDHDECPLESSCIPTGGFDATYLFKHDMGLCVA